MTHYSITELDRRFRMQAYGFTVKLEWQWEAGTMWLIDPAEQQRRQLVRAAEQLLGPEWYLSNRSGRWSQEYHRTSRSGPILRRIYLRHSRDLTLLQLAV